MTAQEQHRARREASVRRVLNSGKARPHVALRGRVAESESDEDGTERTRRMSGGAMLITVRDNSRGRRNVAAWAEKHGVVLERLSDEWGRAERTGNRRLGPEHADVPEAEYRAVGPGPGLDALRFHPDVLHWERCLNIRVGGTAAGSGTLSAGAERRVREGRRESIARAEDRAIATRRDVDGLDADAAVLREGLNALGMERSDVRVPMVAELMRLAARADSLTPAEAARVVMLRRELGI